MKDLTQNSVILAWLRSGKSLTGASAYALCGTLNLHKRLSEVRKRLPPHHEINGRWITTQNGRRVKKYSLMRITLKKHDRSAAKRA